MLFMNNHDRLEIKINYNIIFPLMHNILPVKTLQEGKLLRIKLVHPCVITSSYINLNL